jgi:hypothetical protein
MIFYHSQYVFLCPIPLMYIHFVRRNTFVESGDNNARNIEHHCDHKTLKGGECVLYYRSLLVRMHHVIKALLKGCVSY